MKCSVCGYVINEGEIIPATGNHIFGDAGICTICGENNLSEGLQYTLNSDEASYSVSGRGTCTDTNIVIPAVYDGLPVTSIGYGAFSDCTSIISIIIPNSVTNIRSSAFSGCTSLESITLPFVGTNQAGTGSTYFGHIFGASSYQNNSKYVPSSLKTVVITDATSIGYGAFYSCKGLTNITIPEGVTSIDSYAFYGCSGIVEIDIPNSVTSIKQDAFRYCSNLIQIEGGISYVDKWIIKCDISVTTVILREDTAGIADNAFYGCEDLADLIIPDSVTSIGDYTFRGCTSLESIEIPDGVTSIGDYAFSGCTSLESVNFNENSQLTSIVDYAFNGCSNLFSIDIPDSVTDIGNYAFGSCTNLESVNFSENSQLASIGFSSFCNCSSLKSIAIPDSVTNISQSAFIGCTSLESITLPFVGGIFNSYFGYIFGALSYSDNSKYVPSSLKTVIVTGGTRIESYAFYNCIDIADITIPDSVTIVGNSAFEGCACLESVSFSENSQLTSMGSSAFKGCTSLKELTLQFIGATKDGTENTHFGYIFGASSYSYNSYYVPTSLKTVAILGGESIVQYAFYGCKDIISIIIPENVTSIGTSAFFGCSSLAEITIPESVTSIEHSAFFDCHSLISIIVDEDNAKYKSIDGNLYTKDGKTLIMYAIGKQDASYIITNSVSDIGSFAFHGCRGLTSITIPNSVTSIGTGAFYCCEGLTSISIDNGVTIIGNSAFAGCTSLENIVIPDGVTSIGDYAFSGCTNLTSITIPKSVLNIGGYAFNGCSKLTRITFGGTFEQWHYDIQRGANWNKNTGNYAVYCTDAIT